MNVPSDEGLFVIDILTKHFNKEEFKLLSKTQQGHCFKLFASGSQLKQ